ncbi:hypothetical protein CASFOL_042912 [Castilleja foliolosa]|uniref:Uncharacterized protein n=1 Tax=Castilleja foliolosa TaxID=1961234 RepID=A0ABD3B782_9LAMI
MGNDDGGDIYGDGEGDRQSNYMKSNIDGNADDDSNDIDMYSDSDVNTDSDGDTEEDGNVERGCVVSWLRQFRESDDEPESTSQTKTAKQKLFGDFLGCSRLEIASILPPCPLKTKGSGAGLRRLKSLKEKAIEKSNKPLRLCRKYNQKTTHDSRNCDKIKGVVNL